MLTALVVVFVIAYAAIALEHPLKINKSASALIGAGLLWTIYALSTADHELISHPVSYTHLDVYKRQMSRNKRSNRLHLRHARITKPMQTA